MTRLHFRLSAVLALLLLIPAEIPAALKAASSEKAVPKTPVNDRSTDPDTVGEVATMAIAPTLRRHVVLVGRVSSDDYQAGVLINKDGHILTAIAPSLEPDVTPYLILFPDGHRVVPEVIREDKDKGLVLLKTPELPPGLEPARIAARGESAWFLAGAWSPSPRVGEVPRIHLGRIIRQPKDGEGSLVLDLPLRAPGSPVFDLAGRLVAVVRKSAPNRFACTCVPVADFVNSWPGFPSALTTGDLPVPAALEITEKDRAGAAVREKQLAPTLVDKAPVLTVRQGERAVALGTILSADGLILTKASELGDAPVCQFGDESWPAVLLAVDDETDLALLRIDATNLPSVKWHDAVPEPGAWLYSFCPPEEEDPLPFACGLLSHRTGIPRGHVSFDQPEMITSLGVALEQGDSGLLVAAVLGSEKDDGLKRGDRLTSFDEKKISTRAELTAELAKRRVGKSAEVGVLRDGKPMTLSVTLAPALPWQAPIGVDTDILASSASARRSGFPDVLCHDGILDAPNCGGPVSDSKGRFVGLNIARADKGATFALTVPAIQAACKRLLSQTEAY